MQRESVRAIGAYCAFLFLSVCPFIGILYEKKICNVLRYIYMHRVCREYRLRRHKLSGN